MRDDLPYDMAQHTADWYHARLGRITGSMVGELFVNPRSKADLLGKTAMTAIYRLAGERCLLPDVIADPDLFEAYRNEVNPTNRAMQTGIEREGEARDVYEAVTGSTVAEVGLCIHPERKYFASSPDGVVTQSDGSQGCLEIKCPTMPVYMQYRRTVKDGPSLKMVNAGYYWQCQSHMAVTDSDWCDFAAYCPYVANPIARIQRDPRDQAALMERVEVAEALIQKLTNNI